MNKQKTISWCLMAFVFVFGVMITPNVSAQQALDRLRTDYPAIMEFYGKRLESQKADYIIAIDVSGTMNNHRGTVVPALNAFLDALPEGDYVSIIRFGTKAEEFGMSGKIDKSTIGGFKQSLANVYNDNAAFFAKTDLCAMCNTVLNQLSRPNGNDLKYVFIFTDFINDPSTAPQNWSGLPGRYSSIASTNMVRTYAMQLSGSGSGRDIQMVRNVFANLQTIDVSNSDLLNQWFEGQKAAISVERLKELIKGDYDKWYADKNIQLNGKIGLDKQVRLKYTVEDEVPAFVNGLLLDTLEVVKQSSNIEKVNIQNDSAYKGRGITARVGSLKFFNKAMLQRKPALTLRVVYRPMFTTADEDSPSFANDIRKLGLEQALGQAVELPATKALVIGWNIWLFMGVVLLVLVFLFFFIKMTVLPYKLNNVVVTGSLASDPNKTYSKRFEKEVFLLFGKKGTQLPQAEYVLRVEGCRGFPILVPRSIVCRVTEKPQSKSIRLSRNNSNVSSLRTKVKSGDTIKISQGMDTYIYRIN